MMNKPVFRFAPSPNGHLHIGHAYSALLNQKMAREAGGKLLLRIEDIDHQRCTPELEAQMLRDLEWIGFEWDETPRRQSDHFDEYAGVLEELNRRELLYPSILSRSEIKKIVVQKNDQGIIWPSDPDGVPHYPGKERSLNKQEQKDLISNSQSYALRLNMQKAIAHCKAPLSWHESNTKLITAQPEQWGDIVLARKDVPASYHLCCTYDDSEQGITDIVRGKDLYEATSIHVLLSDILGFSPPQYHHHQLILNNNQEKFSKSQKHKSLKDMRLEGISITQIRDKLGFI